MILTLQSKTHLHGNVWRFCFIPDQPVAWLAGQFMRLEIPHSTPDAAGSTRWFTISGAPYERAITITTRLTHSSFKQALGALAFGDKATMVEAPAGDFIWRQDSAEHLFVAQGIGITPFYAIIKDRIHLSIPVHATLVYASRTTEPAIYQSELNAWAKRDQTLKIQPFAGTLTAPQLIVLMPDFAQRYVYVSGPKSFLSLCISPHQLPLSHLKQDNFPGYAATNY